ncbi:flagella basal body P-ring formation protein FlgA [Nitrosospira multiformis]|uniref:Flagella basal body P-ring formation protein FlgA n=1 Tax=Nitrosospira multiformis TaxID=1231 RepID=A0A2T5I9S0_9PROT|nr:flagellar basal body P-ring formation chaperone FlgA [Nitrosospira multiformis]PTQ80569.1 flagella basal body P-ring formation protein FlgA [Nitrosospira multiformis]
MPAIHLRLLSRILSCSPSLLILLPLILPSSVSAAASAPAIARQDPHAVQQTVLSFLQMQSIGLPGEVEITPGSLDARVALPACTALEPSLPPGTRPWGNTTVMVQCMAPSSWTIYVRATVKVVADYLVTTRPLRQGQVIAASDLTSRKGDLTQLPPGIVTDWNQAIGRTLGGSLPFGSPLRQDMLRAQPAVIQNQTVKLVSSGRGFSVSAEGKALTHATEGQPVKVRSASGTVVSGIARAGAIVEVTY